MGASGRIPLWVEGYALITVRRQRNPARKSAGLLGRGDIQVDIWEIICCSPFHQ